MAATKKPSLSNASADKNRRSTGKRLSDTAKAPAHRKKVEGRASPEKNSEIPVAGIGASAGGLEALEKLFANMPVDTGLAFVVIQHLSTRYKSAMGQLLARSTAMKVVELKKAAKVRPNCIYLNPPDKFVAVDGDSLRLVKPTAGAGVVLLPIDHFFQSLARERQEQAICIILSGSASDGTLGLKAVKAGGGLTFAQSPENAKYSGMPESAIATRMVDFILPVESIPEKLVEIIRHPYIQRADAIEESDKESGQAMNQVFSILLRKTRHDFSLYKINTIRRLVARRMAVHQLSRLSDYLMVLEKDPAEPQHLLKDMLIGVTNFFRDPQAFDTLQEMTIAPLVDEKKAGDPVRVWVPGCSSGEEAYSIAILLTEAMEAKGKQLNIQIFASDIDAEAIHTARTGVYLESIAADVPVARLGRFFTRSDNTFKIKKRIRDCIVFSIHNVISDPPFSKIDLISCRNLLIYLKPEIQKKILPMFHYALNKGGYLFLGPSETVGEFSDHFTALSLKYKLFKQLDSQPAGRYSVHQLPPVPVYTPDLKSEEEAKAKVQPTDIYTYIERLILDEYAPPGVLVGRDLEILQFIGQTDRYLKTPRGRASFNILKMAREGMTYKLNQILLRAIKSGEKTRVEAVTVKHPKGILSVDISVRPLLERPGGKELFIVFFEERRPRPAKAVKVPEPQEAAADAGTIQQLEDELKATKEYLQSTIEELETSNEEFKATNEELQSVNEELQSSNEELETSREELQSTNEELVTVNTEHQQKIEELTKSNNDINNLLESTEIASLFLDLNLCVRRFTPAVTRIINLRQSDTGRPISDITTRLLGAEIHVHARQVVEKLDRCKLEVQDKGGRWYEMRILPYRTLENVIDGVTISFIDITDIRQIPNLRRVTAVFENCADAVTLQDFNGNILAWNRRAAILYGWTEEEALRMHINEITAEKSHPEYAAMMRKVQRGEDVAPFEIQRLTKEGRLQDIRVYASALVDNNGRPVQFATFEKPAKK